MPNDHFKLYVLSEMKYIKENPGLNRSELFPLGWYEIKDYFFKTKVLVQALKEKTLIINTSLYNEQVVTKRSR